MGKYTVESMITRKSAADMRLKKGYTVEVIIKSTEVMLEESRSMELDGTLRTICLMPGRQE
jgi:hypothetical protein